MVLALDGYVVQLVNIVVVADEDHVFGFVLRPNISGDPCPWLPQREFGRVAIDGMRRRPDRISARLPGSSGGF